MKIHKILPALGLLLPSVAQAFPDMIRHGYIHCSSCHVSPTGGSTLTEYGRALSLEALSTWGNEEETGLAHGRIKPPEWLQIGGDVRMLQVFEDTPDHSAARLFLMQADLEAAVTADKFTLVGRGGLYAMDFQSRVHYLMYKPVDSLTFRFGRFMRAHGVNLAEHTYATRAGLGFDQGRETYNFEAGWSTERSNITVTGVLGRIDDTKAASHETGLSTRYVTQLGESNHLLGASYSIGSKEGEDTRFIVGPFATLSLTDSIAWTVEADYTSKKTQGIAQFQRLDWEATKGVHLFLTQELAISDFDNDKDKRTVWGVGAQWFPIPHFEIYATYRKQTWDLVYPDASTDEGWVLFHYYL